MSDLNWNRAIVLGCWSLLCAAVWLRLDVEWFGLTPGDRLNAAIGLFVGGIGLVVGVIGLMISSQQADIAAAQHAHSERERNSKAVLKLIVPNPPVAQREGIVTAYDLYIANEGDKAGWCFWYIGIPKRLRNRIEVQPRTGSEPVQLAADDWDVHGPFDQPKVACFSDDFYLLKFRLTQPVQPGDWMPCGTIAVHWKEQAVEADVNARVVNELRNQEYRILLWFTNSPGGRYPAERGMRKLRLYEPSESWFKNYHGGIELPTDDPDEFN